MADNATVIATRPIRHGMEEIRVAFSTFKGHLYLDARKWWKDGSGEFKPGKGLSVRISDLPWLRAALEKAEAKALADGALDEESYESIGLALPATLTGD
jgi:hypothetical protein